MPQSRIHPQRKKETKKEREKELKEERKKRKEEKKRRREKRNNRKLKQPAFIRTIHKDISQKSTHVGSTLFYRCDVTV